MDKRNIYAEGMQELMDKYTVDGVLSDDYILDENFSTLSDGLKNATADMLKYSQAVKILREELLKLPENRATNTLARNNARRGIESARIQAMSHNTVSPVVSSDYANLLFIDESNVRQQETLLNIAKDNYNEYMSQFSNRTNLTESEQYEVWEKQQAVLEAEQAVLEAYSQVAETIETANSAVLAEYDKRQSESF